MNLIYFQENAFKTAIPITQTIILKVFQDGVPSWNKYFHILLKRRKNTYTVVISYN